MVMPGALGLEPSTVRAYSLPFQRALAKELSWRAVDEGRAADLQSAPWSLGRRPAVRIANFFRLLADSDVVDEDVHFCKGLRSHAVRRESKYT